MLLIGVFAPTGQHGDGSTRLYAHALASLYACSVFHWCGHIARCAIVADKDDDRIIFQAEVFQLFHNLGKHLVGIAYHSGEVFVVLVIAFVGVNVPVVAFRRRVERIMDKSHTVVCQEGLVTVFLHETADIVRKIVRAIVVDSALFVHDTIFLLSKLLNIKEVVIFGKAPEVEDYTELNKRFQLPKSELQLAGAQPNGNLFGLLGYLIPKKWKKGPKKNRKERLQEILNDY